MRKLFIFFILVCSILRLSSQTLPDSKYKTLDTTEFIVTYSMESKRDSNNLDYVRKEETLLFLGKSISYFVSKNSYNFTQERRKLTTVQQVQEFYNNKGNFYPGFTYLIFKNYPAEKLTFTKPTLEGSFKIEESLNLFNWQLTGDTATVAGFKTQKATSDFGGRSWIAWFAPEIPFNDGPYKFNGLPGLIVKVHDNRMHYVFELKYIDKADAVKLIEIKEYSYIKTTKQKFFQAEDAIIKDITSRVKEAGVSTYSQQVAARNMSRRNNPIELKRK